MDKKTIKAAWAEWEAASAATDAAHDAAKAAGGFTTKRVRNKVAADAYALWLASLSRTDAARLAVAGLPDLDEVAAWEAEQAEAAIADANQGKLF